jgi:hypothetical protein
MVTSNGVPNVQGQLPGRLQGRHVSKNRNAGPVNFIGWFGFILARTVEQSVRGSYIQTALIWN